MCVTVWLDVKLPLSPQTCTHSGRPQRVLSRTAAGWWFPPTNSHGVRGEAGSPEPLHRKREEEMAERVQPELHRTDKLWWLSEEVNPNRRARLSLVVSWRGACVVTMQLPLGLADSNQAALIWIFHFRAARVRSHDFLVLLR